MNAKWIWYYGDFEIYHSLKLHTRREKYGAMIPAVWKMDDCYHNVKFMKKFSLEKPETLTVYAKGSGYVSVDSKEYRLEEPITLQPGDHVMVIYVIDQKELPCAYVDGETIVSDESWLVNYYGRDWVNAGCREEFCELQDDPREFRFAYEELQPVSRKTVNGGVLYDFGKQTFAKLCFERLESAIDIYYGESETEALDTKDAYVRALGTLEKEQPCRAFRYLYIRGDEAAYDFKVYYEYLPLEYKGCFRCNDELLNQIWDTSVYTLHLNSREFFLDGIKRDRWVWSGDAYQSYLVSRYIFFDEDIIRRTILALRGKDPMEKHLNTILDYSFYWIMSIRDYYEMTEDKAFLEKIYPKMKTLMEFCLSRLDQNGFAAQVEDDWIFVDWADMDKTGAVCAEQLLLLRSLETMAECSEILGISHSYDAMALELKEKIRKYFWREEKGAFIDSFESGLENVTRHANIFALLFGYADEIQREQIIQKVLLNDEITQIKTPYFKFYELETMCQTGSLELVTEKMKSYWGGMLQLGATSFWEEYNPDLLPEQQYEMYGDAYGKSLCHAWGASPVYLIGKYYMGVTPTAPGYKTFAVKPDLGGLEWFEGTVPIKDGSVNIRMKDGKLSVLASRAGGTLIYENKVYTLEAGVAKIINM